MGVRRIVASSEFLTEVLRTGHELRARVRDGLPDDAEIVGVGALWDAHDRAERVWIDVESASFPDTAEPTGMSIVFDRL